LGQGSPFSASGAEHLNYSGASSGWNAAKARNLRSRLVFRRRRSRIPATRRSKIMSILAWLVVGLIAGFIGSLIVNRRGEGLLIDVALGVVGAVVGGFLFNFFGASGISGINLYSIGVAVVGAIVVLLAYHAMRRA
jgi:uncharacterized membrane protein YeaQ/YmgE (transglycosylase-associated protein family)